MHRPRGAHSLRQWHVGRTGDRFFASRLDPAGQGQALAYGGLSSPLGDRVKISTPVSVTPTVCSNWADSERSRVTAVQPSDSTFTCGRPRLIIGSTVNSMPGLSTTPS